MKNYDVVIVGGGISGLYTMYNLRKQYPRLKVLLLEKNNRFGGRVYTYYEKVDGIQYRMDLGAGRLGFSHKLILSLIKNMDLSKDIIPITNDKTYIHIDKDNSKIGTHIQKKAFNIFYKLLNSSKIRKIHFGASDYPQYRDRTPLKLYAYKDHNTRKRMQNYFSRHSGTRSRSKAIKKEKKKSKGLYNSKILSHEYLW